MNDVGSEGEKWEEKCMKVILLVTDPHGDDGERTESERGELLLNGRPMRNSGRAVETW